jgi:hypothetical protein
MYDLRSVSSPQICVFHQLSMDLLEDTDLRRGHGSEAIHGFVGRHRFEERTQI